MGARFEAGHATPYSDSTCGTRRSLAHAGSSSNGHYSSCALDWPHASDRGLALRVAPMKKERLMKQLRFLFIPWVIFLCIIASLVGCTASPNSSLTPNAHSTTQPTTITGGATVVPSATCDEAVQLILQKQIRGVTIYVVQGTQVVTFIFLDLPDGGQRAISNVNQCEPKLTSAVKQVNVTLPKNQQVVVNREVSPG